MSQMSLLVIGKSPSFETRSFGAPNFPTQTANNSFHEQSFQDESKANDADYYNFFSARENSDIFEFTFANSYAVVCTNITVAIASAVFLVLNCYHSELDEHPLFVVTSLSGTILELAQIALNVIEYVRPGIMITRIYYALLWWIQLFNNTALTYVVVNNNGATYLAVFCYLKSAEYFIKIIEALIRKLVISISSRQ